MKDHLIPVSSDHESPLKQNGYVPMLIYFLAGFYWRHLCSIRKIHNFISFTSFSVWITHLFFASASGKNWHLEVIKRPEAWDIPPGGQSVGVGVVEAGFDIGHEDINLPPDICILPNGQIGVQQADCLCGDVDRDSHGTHVLGIIGARSNNDIGITGIMWEKNLRLARIPFVVQPNGNQEPDIIRAIQNLLLLEDEDLDVKVINLSWGRPWGAYPNGQCPSADNPKQAVEFSDSNTKWASIMDRWLSNPSIEEFLIVQAAGNDGCLAPWTLNVSILASFSANHFSIRSACFCNFSICFCRFKGSIKQSQSSLSADTCAANKLLIFCSF